MVCEVSLLGAFAKLRHVCPSVHVEHLGPTGQILVKFSVREFIKNLPRKKFHYNLTRTTDALHEDLCTFLIISRSVLPGM
jgi:hypothetical protein